MGINLTPIVPAPHITSPENTLLGTSTQEALNSQEASNSQEPSRIHQQDMSLHLSPASSHHQELIAVNSDYSDSSLERFGVDGSPDKTVIQSNKNVSSPAQPSQQVNFDLGLQSQTQNTNLSSNVSLRLPSTSQDSLQGVIINMESSSQDSLHTMEQGKYSLRRNIPSRSSSTESLPHLYPSKERRPPKTRNTNKHQSTSETKAHHGSSNPSR